ncbi:MAG: Fe-S cluster assembly protein SufD [Bacteroides sp.]|nr:Fe-S cluster assembly protein SufD [Roseburia sp.]MCM1346137.1 Fe-S cluster assembly protein SufD [Bacteroides sp.]MCM1421216.1 Fe-S cluster assembly protein SufD [Bacteroides sp.]
MSSAKQYIDLYHECREVIMQHSSTLMNAVRDEAFGCFERMGFPTQKVERYKYTDVEKAFAPNYGLNLTRINIPVNPQDVFKCDVPNLSTQLFFIENDTFYKEEQGSFRSEDGAIIASLKDASEQYPELVGKYYAKLADMKSDAITALNTALAQDGLFVYVPRNVQLKRPVQIVNILRSGVDMMVNRRVLIVLEEGADATFLFCDHAMDNVRFLTTQVVEIFAADNSHADIYELEETHTKCNRFSNLYIKTGNYCTVSHNNITLFNGLTRNTTDVVLDGEYSELTLNGCVVADKRQHVDNNTLIDHRKPNCTSNELYKYVVDEAAVGAFAGRILVRKNAQHTVSQETNANLCATKEARVYTQPMLEIYADDVKCAHGSTVGMLDEAALFYMQQRGISADEARMLLKFAFVGQVIEQVRLEPLRDRLHRLVEKRFRGELNKCVGCAICK